jgi:hypothetical protein
LTGESEPVLKATAVLADPAPLGDRVNMVCSGTAVTRGRGRAVVTTTGIHTEMGRIASLLGRTGEDRTPLQREIDFVGRTLGIAVIGSPSVRSPTPCTRTAPVAMSLPARRCARVQVAAGWAGGLCGSGPGSE